jgi:hypothetical protein
MEGRWREDGGKMEGRWREDGGKMEGRWREEGGSMGGRWGEDKSHLRSADGTDGTNGERSGYVDISTPVMCEPIFKNDRCIMYYGKFLEPVPNKRIELLEQETRAASLT